MTKKPKVIFSHPNAKKNGTRLIMSITPATEEKEGYLMLQLQKQASLLKWDEENESIINLSHIEIAKFIAVMRGYDESVNDGKGIWHRIGEAYCGVCFRHTTDPISGYILTITNEKGPVSILLNTYEVISLCEVMQIALSHIVFG